MVVNVTQLAGAIRAGDGVTAPVEPLLSIITRLDGVADALIDLYATGAPSAIRDEAKIRFAGYLYDSPSAPSGDRYAAAWRNSGAASLVSAWVVRRVAADSSTDARRVV